MGAGGVVIGIYPKAADDVMNDRVDDYERKRCTSERCGDFVNNQTRDDDSVWIGR